MLIVAFILACLFAALLLTYNSEAMQRLDETMATALFGNEAVQLFHYFGETLLVIAAGIVIILYCLWRKKRAEALLAFSTIFIGYGINQAVKNVVARPRPLLEDQLTSYSFPSGHTMASLLLLMTLVYMLTYAKKKQLGVVLMWAVGIVYVALTGLSRVAQGRHFFTDVLAGWTLATAWLLVCLYVFQRYKKKQHRAH